MPSKGIERLKELEEKVRNKYGKQFDCGGIYAVLLEGKIVYIGKSIHMTERIAEHMYAIESNDPGHKYQVMKQALIAGYKVEVKKIQRCDVKNNIGDLEGIWIRHYMPPLNYQIPKENDYQHFTIQNTAKTITLEELLK